jgi:hypothetical protein
LNQYRVARAKFRLDLFEQRYAVFEIMWTYLSRFGQDTREEKEAEASMHNAIPRAYFLFGGVIGRFFEEVNGMAIQYRVATTAIRSAQRPEDEEQLKNKMQESMVFMQENVNTLRERFKPYLGFHKWF